MGTVTGLIKHALMPFTKFDEDSIPALLTAFPRPTDASHGRHYTFRALSRPFHSVLHQISIWKLFLKYYTRSRLQRVHRFADARTFVQLLYIDSRMYTSPHRLCRIFSICFAFISDKYSVTCSLFSRNFTYNYDTQIWYIKSVELLCKRCTNHHNRRFTSRLCSRSRMIIVHYRFYWLREGLSYRRSLRSLVLGSRCARSGLGTPTHSRIFCRALECLVRPRFGFVLSRGRAR